MAPLSEARHRAQGQGGGATGLRVFAPSLRTREAKVSLGLKGPGGSHTHIPASSWLASPEPVSDTSHGHTGQLHRMAGHTSAFHVIWGERDAHFTGQCWPMQPLGVSWRSPWVSETPARAAPPENSHQKPLNPATPPLQGPGGALEQDLKHSPGPAAPSGLLELLSSPCKAALAAASAHTPARGQKHRRLHSLAAHIRGLCMAGEGPLSSRHPTALCSKMRAPRKRNLDSSKG